jgi:hypothetical protein
LSFLDLSEAVRFQYWTVSSYCRVAKFGLTWFHALVVDLSVLSMNDPTTPDPQSAGPPRHGWGSVRYRYQAQGEKRGQQQMPN